MLNLVMPGVTAEVAADRTEEIRRQCQDLCILEGGASIKITLSLGVATYPDDSRDIAELIIKVDKALDQSKQSGRNRATAWARMMEI